MIGILNVYKPKGMTSHDVVSFVRRNLHIKRVGHTGTLDPDAEGVLPILIGKATKLSDFLTASRKRYIARVRLGIATDTDDMSGETIYTREVLVDEADVIAAVNSFVGEIEQIPPMYSAIKVSGQKLYQLARKGIVAERKPRKITIYSLSLSDFSGDFFTLDVDCSKGTYIRALCRDIGEKLGTGAAMEGLIRTQSGNFKAENSYTLEQIEQAAKENTIKEMLVSIEDVLDHINSVSVDEKTALKIRNGIRLRPQQIGMTTFFEGEMVRIYENGVLLCILKAIKTEDGENVLAMEKSFY